MNYALIVNRKVNNIVELAERSADKFPNAVKIGERPVGIGDSYIDGKFYRDGVEILTPYEEQQKTINEYEAALSAIEKALGVTS